MRRWLLVSGFTGDEVVARSGMALRRMRPRARPGYARATGRRITLTRPTARIFAQPRRTVDAGQLTYALTNARGAFVRRVRGGRGYEIAGGGSSEYWGLPVSKFTLDSLVRRGILEERRGRYYLNRAQTATYRGESRYQRPTRMPYRDD